MCKDIVFTEKLLTGLHPVDVQSTSTIATLFHEGFKDTIDAEYNSANAYLDEIKAVIDGRYGQFLPSCSYYSKTPGSVSGVTMVTLFRSVPLLAYVVTAPEWQGKGVATALIQSSEQALVRQGYKKLYLVVTKQNYRASSLYRTLGFREVGENWDLVLRREKQ